jgi:hypothetical protein
VSADGEMILAGLDSVGTWDAVIDAEPALAIMLVGERLDAALLAIANFVDLKSPYTLGHAGAVSRLAAEAGARLEMAEDEVRTLRRAGLIHDLGRLGVSNAIWDKPGPLGAGEWDGCGHLREDRRLVAGGGEPLRGAARPAARGRPRGEPRDMKIGRIPDAGEEPRPYAGVHHLTPRRTGMPKVSKQSASTVEAHGPVEDRHEDVNRYTINFVRRQH